jgi:TPR repeat protein/serine/threonine protein kinase
MSEDLEPTLRSPAAQATPITPPAAASSGAGVNLGSGRGSTSLQSLPSQDLSSDKLILSAARMELEGRATPVLGGIPLLAKLGQGGMGAVYYGIHPRLKTEVAVKVLPFHLADKNPDMIPRLFREAKIAAHVRSPHLVQVSDVNEEKGLYYLVMEFVRGDTAGALLRSARHSGQPGLAESIALEICIAAATGLSEAHAHGIIHRDIKPENIMVPRRRAAEAPGEYDYAASKLADLGLARGENLDTTLTADNAAMGTPGFMSPEQIEDARRCGKPADVFSLGGTLYALLCGRSPFASDSFIKTIRATVESPHTPIHAIRAEISELTSLCIDRCLSKNPAERYPDASSLLTALMLCRTELSQPGSATIRAKEVLTQIHAQVKADVTAGPPTSRAAEVDVSKSLESAGQPTPATIPARKPRGARIALGVAVIALVCLALWRALMSASPKTEPGDTRTAIRTETSPRNQAVAPIPVIDPHAEEWAARKASFDSEYKQLMQMLPDEPERALNNLSRVEALSAPDASKGFPDLSTGIAMSFDEIRRSAQSSIEKRKQESDKHKLEVAEQALATAFNAASMAAQRKEWDQVILSLEEPLKALGEHPHPNRKAAEALIEQARQEKHALDTFAEKLAAAEKYFREGHLAASQAALQECLKLSPPSQVAHINDLLSKIAKTTTSNEYSAAMNDAERAEGEQRWTDAEAAYTRALKARSDDAAAEKGRRHAGELALIDEANRALAKKDFDAAHAAFQSTLKTYPNSTLAKEGIQKLLDALCDEGRKFRDSSPPDYAAANAAFRKAANLGHGPARDCLGRAYENGLGVKVDLEEAARWLRLGSDTGYVIAQLNYSRVLEHGTGVPQNQVEADRLNMAALDKAEKYCREHPYAEVLVTLGWLYANGRGVEKNYEKSIQAYEKAAEMGYAPAEAFLGNMYANFPSVPANYPEAIKHFQKGANAGLAIAQFELGTLYEHGLGVEKNYPEAAKWYAKAADQEQVHAEHNLGFLYLNGYGVPKSPEKALAWLLRADQHGDTTVGVNIGRMYANGEGIPKDPVEAVRWYRKAANAGDQYGEVHLGFMYQEGHGVEKDINQAAMWYRKAAAQGNADATRLLKQLTGAK